MLRTMSVAGGQKTLVDCDERSQEPSMFETKDRNINDEPAQARYRISCASTGSSSTLG